MTRRLLIDAQVFHTPAFHRGMGKYSIELIKAVITQNSREKQWDVIELVLSDNLPLEAAAQQMLQEQLRGAAPVKLGLKKDGIFDAPQIMAYNRRLLDQHIAELHRSDPSQEIDFLILSPLQGGICSVFPSDPRVRRSLICYDLIPFLFHSMYFRNPIAARENMTKLTEVLTADVFLAISKTVANDLSIHLGVDPERIHNIDGGPIDHSSRVKKLAVSQPFILMPTGNDLRKNNQTGILGFGEFNKQHSNKYRLVITSYFDPAEVAALSQLAPNVIFTGNIKGEELNYLYQECEALLFPSYYEGLGLPVLEAVQAHKPVACSDIAVFREMSSTAFSYFDPSLGTSIAQGLEAALYMAIDTNAYAQILEKYQWSRSAALTMKVLTGSLPSAISRLQLAVFAPNPSCTNPVSRMVQTAHASLVRVAQPTYFLDGEPDIEPPRPNLLQFVSGTKDVSGGQAIPLGSYDQVVYHLANTTACAKILFTALARPGIAILHDLDLGIVWEALRERQLISDERYHLEKRLHQQFEHRTQAGLLCALLARQHGVAVFDEAAKATVEKIYAAMELARPVVVLPLPTASLVYDDIIPAQDNAIVSFDAAHEIWPSLPNEPWKKHILRYRTQPGVTEPVVSVADDRTYEDMLSRVRASLLTDTLQLPHVLEGMRYGVVPLTTTRTSLSSAINVADAKAASLTIQKFASSEQRYQEAAVAARKEVRQAHAYRSYAEALHAFVRHIRENA